MPYCGSAPALQDLLAGNVQLMIDPYGPFVGRAEAGLVRVLAVTSLERIAALPDVPTMSETPGLEGFEATGFVGVVAPAATPRPVIARLEEAVAWAMREPDLERIYVAQGQTPRFADAAAFRDRIGRGAQDLGAGGTGREYYCRVRGTSIESWGPLTHLAGTVKVRGQVHLLVRPPSERDVRNWHKADVS